MHKTIATPPGKPNITQELTQEEINKIKAREAEFIKNQEDNKYKEQRQSEYGSIEDQLDMMYWDKINNTTNWEDHITIVKNKYPKPEK